MVLLLVIFVSLIITLLYTLSWVKFQKYQFLERDYNKVAKFPEYSRSWHYWKGLNQILFFSIMVFLVGLHIATMNCILYWILFDGFFNKTILKREFFYVGKTSIIDKLLHTLTYLLNIPFKNTIPVNTVSEFIKMLLLTISIILIF